MNLRLIKRLVDLLEWS